MKSITLRICLVLTAILMFLTATVSCSNPNNPSGTTTSGVTPDTTAAELPPESIDSFAPGDVDFKNQTVTVLCWEDAQFHEFYIEKETGNLLDDAIYKRNRAVEQTLNVKLNFSAQKGNASNVDNFVKYVQNTNIAGSDEPYSIIATYSRTAGALAVGGYLQDMNATQYIDTDKPWWPEFVIEPSTINGKLYFATGDISTNMLYNMDCVFYNKQLVNADMNGIVTSGNWTLDKMIELSAGAYKDKDGDGLKSAADTFGFVHYAPQVNMLCFGMDIRVIDRDENGALKLSDVYGDVKVQSLLEKLNSQFYATDEWYYMGSGTTNGKAMQTVFAEGRSVFISEAVSLPEKKLLQYGDLSYGVLPLPKYDTAQENYRTLLGNPITLYGIPKSVTNTDRASAVIECLAQEAYRFTTPALFENIFKLRYVANPTESKMFDLIRNCSVIELGIVFNEDLEKLPGNALYTKIAAQNSDWTSFYDANKTILASNIKKINDKLTEAK